MCVVAAVAYRVERMTTLKIRKKFQPQSANSALQADV